MANVQIAIIDQENTQIALAAPSEAQVNIAVPGIQGPAGQGVPNGGAANQVLFKQSGTDYDTAWSEITSDMIGDLEIVNADVSASAAIAGTKISPDFGSQAVVTTGTSTAASFIPTSSTVPTNGVYLPAANNVALATNGTGRLFVDANGYVGVGQASPSTYFHVNGGTVNNVAIFESTDAGAGIILKDSIGSSTLQTNGAVLQLGVDEDNAVANSAITFRTDNGERARITSNGNLGLGTSSPDFTLDVSGTFRSTGIARLGTGQTTTLAYIGDPDTVGNKYISIGRASALTDVVNIQGVDAGAGSASIALQASGGNVGIGTTSPSYQLDVAGQARFGGSNGLVFGVGNAFVANQGELFSIGTTPMGLGTTGSASLQLYTNSSERARIDSSGRLLVGTASSPSAGGGQYSLLVVQGYQGLASGGGDLSIQRGQAATAMSSGTDLGYIKFNDNAGNTFAHIAALVDATPGAGNYPGRLVFSVTADGASSPTERLRITSDGNVGIGTGSPGSFGFFAVRGSAALGGSYGNVSAHFSDGANSSLFIKHAAGELGYFTDGAVAQTFYTSSTERARIDSSGRLLVGTASSPSAGQGQYSRIVVQGYIGNDTSAGYFSLARGEAATSITSGETIGVINFTDNAGNTFAQIIADADAAAGSGDYPGRLVFSTTADGESSPTERMRIASNGSVATFCSNATDGIWASSAATAGTTRNLFIGSYGGSNVYSGTISYRVYTNGNVVNTNDSYGPLVSDIKYKENIVDAGSQWDDFKAIKFRKFNFKPETGFDTFTQLGVIAQEVELVSPGLVVETPDVDENGNDLGTTTKTVKSSVLTKKALIALQEAMERIENLEAEVAALKGS